MDEPIVISYYEVHASVRPQGMGLWAPLGAWVSGLSALWVLFVSWPGTQQLLEKRAVP